MPQMGKEDKFDGPTSSAAYSDLNTGEATSGTDNERAYSTNNGMTAAERSLELESAAELNSPKDVMHLVKIILVIQGVGMLFPWNTVLTITTYWSWKLTGSSFETSYNNYFDFIFSVILLIVSLVFSRIQHRIGMKARVMYPLAIQLLVYIVLLILVYVNSSHGNGFFGVMIFLIIILGVCVGFNQPGVYTVAAFLPARYQKYPVQGEAWAGVIVSSINVITLAGSTTIQSAATAFFAVSIAVIIACLSSYTYLVNCEYFHYWRNFYFSVEGQIKAAEEAELGIEGTEVSEEIGWNQYVGIIFQVKDMAFSAWFTFAITLLVFPVLPLSVAPYTDNGSRFFGDLWIPIYTFLFFNSADITGRLIGQFIIAPKRSVPYLCIARSIFLPLFVFCHNKCLDPATGAYVDMHLPVAFKSDAAPIIFILAFGFTNGYLFNCIMYHAPNCVKGPERAVGCSFVISSLIFGLLTGSATSFGARSIICPGSA